MFDFYNRKRILVTGAAGTVGKEITKQLLEMKPEELRLVDNNETETFFLMEEFREKNVNCFLGDVRDRQKITSLCEGIDIVIHAAALKHVILSEYNPTDVVQTNILGVENIIQAAKDGGASHVMFTSSDKAVNPTNVMGTSKLMGERLITAANILGRNDHTVYASTRFGNVIGSRGSVVPLFVKQIKRGGPVTITDDRMTRFVMTIREAASLVLASLVFAKGGEVFVTKMPVVKIRDLAEVMVEMLAPVFGHDPSDIEFKTIGAKPGEKLYEELMSEEETFRSMELKDMFVVTPAFRSIYKDIEYAYSGTVSDTVEKSYISSDEPCMDKAWIKDYFEKHNVLGSVIDLMEGGA
jgi:FlaA1/EpsC-like NDP-sugar epimerase